MSDKRIFLCAGEPSGDSLGAGLIQALKKIYPNAKFIGVGGPKMQAAGCELYFSMDAITAMGLVEILPKLWDILSRRRLVVQFCLKQRFDVFIGIDSPDFNLPIEMVLKKQGIKTVQYVSPTVWAWRSGRVHTVAGAADLLLSVFPFEKSCYAQTPLWVEYVGHRAADSLPTLFDSQMAARQALGLNFTPEDKIVALLPGSRHSEIQRLGLLFLEAAQLCVKSDPHLKFIVAAANDRIAAQMAAYIKAKGIDFPCHVVVGKTHAAIKAADVVLVASGTATLETFLLDRPMVVAYRVNAITAWFARRLIKVKYVAQPNLLAQKLIVPEFLQEAATPENLSQAVLHWLTHPLEVKKLRDTYKTLLGDMQWSADERAAQAVAKLLKDRRVG